MKARDVSRSQSSAMGKAKKASDDQACWEEVCSLAEYEIESDPYRGIVNLEVPSPWLKCQYSEKDCGTVSLVVGCVCPSLISWTKEHETACKRKKKKHQKIALQHLGRRPAHPTFKCPCDFNPFCLASLGGVMDDFLAESAEEIFRSRESQVLQEPNASSVESIIHIDDSSDENLELEVIDADTNDNPSVDLWTQKAFEESVGKSIILDTTKTAAEAFLEDFSFSAEELDHTNPNSVFSVGTKEQLLAIRREVDTDIDRIRSYVDNISFAQPNFKYTSEGIVDRLRVFHNSLLFPNPFRINPQAIDRKLRFAVPPGMKNLGATCYLNTQLQCLARNTAFLEGIFAWKPSIIESRMNSVLSSLQQIMARLTYGVEATIATDEFSQALGLQNDEMQDPNEFARLLFERMHEAFQQSSQFGAVESSLSTLLPSLFEGEMTYETRCHCCGFTSKRTEKFMDINLPIVHPQSSIKTANGQRMIQDVFEAAKKSDRETSIQYCLDEYMRAEELGGDNQYWCGSCAIKRDASRQLVFTMLPPVLNLQLCRYVFDRKSLTKKKLTDKVLLPRNLHVKCTTGPNSTSYRLCAVMKHLGNSAYQGHYIAEAMDWQTGIWFEFNDENVSFLENGLICCPEDTNASSRKAKGSQDAYNIYYVKESFLGTCARDSVLDRKIPKCEPIIQKVGSERRERYQMVADMCRNDAKVTERKNRRKRGLLTLLKRHFHSDSSLVRFGSATPDFAKDSVWVDGAGLRYIFSCTSKSGDDLLHMLARQDLQCVHCVGLEPTVARCGKIIPTPMIIELYEMLRIEMGSPVFSLVKSSKDSFSAINIECGQCCDTFRLRLRETLHWIRSLRLTLQSLDLNHEDIVGELENDNYIYAVSKRFISAFRKSASDFLKKLASIESLSASVECVEEKFASQANIDVDVKVNSAIACDSGKCCPLNKRTARYVSERVWQSIQAFFPQAITLKKLKSQELIWLMCSECERSEKEKESFQAWTELVTSVLSLEVLKGRRNPRTIMLLEKDKNSLNYFLVHRKDLERLWDSYKILSAQCNTELPRLRNNLVRNMFSTSSTAEENGDLHKRVLQQWAPIPLLCSEHYHVLNPVVLTLSPSQNPTRLWRFQDNIRILSEEEYCHFVRVVLNLYLLVYPPSRNSLSSSSQGTDVSEIEIHVDALCSTLGSSHHPKIQAKEASGDSGDATVFFTCFVGTTHVNISFTPSMCADQQCNIECIEIVKKWERSGQRENGSEEVDPPSHLMSDDGTFLDNVVELIDEPVRTQSDDPEVCLRLVFICSNSNLDDVIDSLSQIGSEVEGIRRSSRKRKQRYNLGDIMGEDILRIRRSHNMAAARLHILEKHSNFRLEDPIVLVPNLVLCEPEHKYCKIAIPFDWNERIFSEVVCDAIRRQGLPEDDCDKLMETMTIIAYTDERDLQKRKTGRRLRDDEAQAESSLESLLKNANLTDRRKLLESTKKGSRRIERGFTGTFLHSTPTVLSGEVNSILDGQFHGDDAADRNEFSESSKMLP